MAKRGLSGVAEAAGGKNNLEAPASWRRLSKEKKEKKNRGREFIWEVFIG